MSFLGKVDYVIDGDSLKLIMLFGDGYYRFNSRVSEIDTP